MIASELSVLYDTLRKGRINADTVSSVDSDTCIYPMLSSFSNQDGGGILFYGDKAPITDIESLNRIKEQLLAECLQMEPEIYPVVTTLENDGNYYLSAEIPGIDRERRPCYYKGQGKIKGSFIRTNGKDHEITELELHFLHEYPHSWPEILRPVEGMTMKDLDGDFLRIFMMSALAQNPCLNELSRKQELDYLGLTKDGRPTLLACLVFGKCPQAFFPKLTIEISYEGKDISQPKEKINGTIPQMVTAIKDLGDSLFSRPEIFVEAVINALVHRDYSEYTENWPIQITVYPREVRIRNPGGLLGYCSVKEMERYLPNHRNPHLESILEALGIIDCQTNGIKTMRTASEEEGFALPRFHSELIEFTADLQRKPRPEGSLYGLTSKEVSLLEFCKTWKTKKEIAAFLELDTVNYAKRRFILPLVSRGFLTLSDPYHPGSSRQMYLSRDF